MQICGMFAMIKLTSKTAVDVVAALVVPRVLHQASVSICLIFLFNQMLDQNCLQEAEQHQSKNSNAVDS